MECVPTARVEVVMLAVPLLSVAVPRTVFPFRKLTCSPSGGRPTIALTFAVKVTFWPPCDWVLRRAQADMHGWTCQDQGRTGLAHELACVVERVRSYPAYPRDLPHADCRAPQVSGSRVA